MKVAIGEVGLVVESVGGAAWWMGGGEGDVMGCGRSM